MGQLGPKGTKMRAMKRFVATIFLAGLIGGNTAAQAVDNSPSAAVADRSHMSAREVVEAFQALAFVEYKPVEAILEYVSPDVIEHDPTIPSTREAIIEYMEQRDWTTGGPKSDIKRIISDGEYVVVHHHLVREPGTPGFAVIDMFRVENGWIVEHWDVLQPVPEGGPNTVGMF